MHYDDWIVISGILEEIDRVLRQARDPVADVLTELRKDAERGHRADVVAKLTSGEMWNHMGSSSTAPSHTQTSIESSARHRSALPTRCGHWASLQRT